MPSEAQQSNLQQPWKKWHADLNPLSRKDVQEGNVILKKSESGHGTVAIDQKDVDLTAEKEIPKMYVRLQTVLLIKTKS